MTLASRTVRHHRAPGARATLGCARRAQPAINNTSVACARLWTGRRTKDVRPSPGGVVVEGARTEEETLVAGGRGVTVARGVSLAALVLAVVLVAWLLLRGNGGHEYQLVF